MARLETAVSTAVKALEYGAFHYLTKPIPLGSLEEVVDKAARLRRMGRMKRQAAELIERSIPSHSRAPLENSFYKALDSLWMAYQPILRANDGHVYGYEALLRSKEASLPHPGAVLPLGKRLGKLFDKIYLKTKVHKLEEASGGVRASLEGEEVADKQPVFERVLVAVGRAPVIADLESVGIRPDEQGCIAVDERFATTGRTASTRSVTW